MKNGKKNPSNKQSRCIGASNVLCLKVFYLELQTFSCSVEFYRWTRTLFLNFCAVGLCEKKTNFTTTLQRNMLEGKVAVGLRWWEGGGGDCREKLVWNPALQHCHLLARAQIPPLKPAGLLRTNSASQRQRRFLLFLPAHQTVSSWL